MEKQSIFKTECYKGITYTMLLDKDRKRYVTQGLPIPLKIRITWQRNSMFVDINKTYSYADYQELCDEENSPKSRVRLGERKELRKMYEHVGSVIKSLAGEQAGDNNLFTFENFKRKYFGLLEAPSITIYSLWRDVANEKAPKTRDAYTVALNRFIKDVGKNVTFDMVTRQLVERWRTKMLSSTIKAKDGVKPFSKTTANIYLRSFSVVCHEAQRKGLLKEDASELFAKLSIRGKNASESRKHEYLSVEEWQKLWAFYETDGDGNDEYQLWRHDYKHNRLEALGMLLFMYLANGINLRDLLELRYDGFYFTSGKRELRFKRHKVANRTSQEVVIPILPEMRTIINRYNEDHGIMHEIRNALIFPYLQGVVSEDERNRLTAQYNHVIRKNLASVIKAVGLRVVPTPTWARHSFATNLTQAGVDKDYISAAMAHTDNGTTDNYIDHYSYEQMMDYNGRLLHKELAKASQLKSLLDTMSDEEISQLLKQRSERQQCQFAEMKEA
jgi:integrase